MQKLILDKFPVYYQRQMEKFYNALADVIFQKNYGVYYIDEIREESVPYPELLLFEESIYSEPHDDILEEVLGHVVEKGYRILMNFYAQDILNGNLVVKIRDKWFAFGNCRSESPDELYATEVWPLKYILPNLRQLEIKLRYAVPIQPWA